MSSKAKRMVLAALENSREKAGEEITAKSQCHEHFEEAEKHNTKKIVPEETTNKQIHYVWKPESSTAGTKVKLIRMQKVTDSESESFEEDIDDSFEDPLFEAEGSAFASSLTDTDIEDVENVADKTPVVLKGRKRIAQLQEWLKEKTNLLRNSGEAYTSTSKTGKKMEARKLRDPCGEKCRLKCSTKLGEAVRHLIFKKYWELKDICRQRDFISKNMDTIKPRYRYTKTPTGRHNNNAFHFEVNEQRIRVCKYFFKATLDINDRAIRTVIAKKDTGFVSEDLRGKQCHKKLDPDIKDSVRRHIESIPRIESHYLRSQTSQEYIDGGKTISDLFRDYKAECIDNGQPHANLVMYSRIFNSEFNLSFFVPKKNRCELCVAYENMESENKVALQEKYDRHQQEKLLSRQEKENDKKKADNNFRVACYDLQAVLPAPRGEVSVFYYKSKLKSYNFTICELKSERVECYFWHEGLAKRGTNEIGTCVYKFLEKTANLVKSDDLEVVFYSYNCCGQQKNRFIINLYMHAVSKLQIKAITHKFLIKGHTQNEGDSAHSVIEKSIKKVSKVWTDLCAFTIRDHHPISKKENVTEMGFNDFIDLKDLCEQYGNSFAKCVSDDKIGDIKIIRIEKENPFKFLYKTSYSDTVYKTIDAKQTRHSKLLFRIL